MKYIRIKKQTPTNYLRWNNGVLEQKWNLVVETPPGNHYGSVSVMYDRNEENITEWRKVETYHGKAANKR